MIAYIIWTLAAITWPDPIFIWSCELGAQGSYSWVVTNPSADTTYLETVYTCHSKIWGDMPMVIEGVLF